MGRKGIDIDIPVPASLRLGRRSRSKRSSPAQPPPRGAIAGAVVVLSRQTITDWPAAAIAVVSLGLLLRWKVKEPILVGLGAAAGIALHWPW